MADFRQGQGLTREAASASGWSIASRLARYGSQLVLYVFLARLLSPAEFGTVTLIGLTVTFLQIVVEGGVSDALVRVPILRAGHLSTAKAVNGAIGLAGCILLFLVAPLLAKAFAVPQGAFALRVVAAVPAFTSFSQNRIALLRRSLRFGDLAWRQAIATMAASAVAIGFLLAGAGVASMAAYHVAQSAILLVSLLSVARPPMAAAGAADAQEILGFASRSIGIGLLGQTRSLLPGTFIGLALGPAALGFFGLAQRIVGIVYDAVWGPIVEAALPFFTRFHDDRLRFMNAARTGTRFVVALLCPLFAGLAITAPDVVRVLGGASWRPSAIVLTGAALSLLVTLPNGLQTALLKSADKGWRVIRILVVAIVVDVTALALATPFGLFGVSVALVVRSLVFVPWQAWYGGVNELRATSATIGDALLCLVPMLACVALVELFADGAAPVVRLLMATAIGGLAYGLMAWRRFPEVRTIIQERLDALHARATLRG